MKTLFQNMHKYRHCSPFPLSPVKKSTGCMSLLEKKTHVGRAVCGSTNKKLLYFNMDKGKKKKKT